MRSVNQLYRDRLRNERKSIVGKAVGLPSLDRKPVVQVGILIIEVIANLADTIQTLHEEGPEERSD